MISQTGGGMEIFMEKKYFVYLLKCSDQSLYCGYTDDVEKRLKVHNSGKGAKYTKSHQVIALDALWSAETRSEASMLEAAIKRLRPEKKRQLIESPERLAVFLGARLDTSIYRAEATFSLAPLLAQAGQVLPHG